MALTLRQSCLLNGCVIVYFNFVLLKLLFDLLSVSFPPPSSPPSLLQPEPNTTWDVTEAPAVDYAAVATGPATHSCSEAAVVFEDRRNWTSLFYSSQAIDSSESEAAAPFPPLLPPLDVELPPLVIEDRRNWSSLFVAGRTGAVGPSSSRAAGRDSRKSQSLEGEDVADASTLQLDSLSPAAAGRETRSFDDEAPAPLADASIVQLDSLSSLADTAAAAAADPTLAQTTTSDGGVARGIASGSDGNDIVVQPELTVGVSSLTDSRPESPATASTTATISAGSDADDVQSGNGERGVSPTSAMPVSFVACRLGIGRLGNNMFIYASALGVSLRHGVALALVVDSSTQAHVQQLAAAFRLGTASVLPSESGVSFATVVDEAGWGRYTPAVEDPRLFRSARPLASSPSGSSSTGGGVAAAVLLSGYLQSWKYFEAYADRVRDDFTFVGPLARAADEYVRTVAAASSAAASALLVGVHVRRGDMVSTSLYGVAPPGYLHTAMDYMVSRRGPALFVATSDDVGWTRQALAGSTHAVVYPERSAELDLAILARCNHTIITGGSYGWWAGWLAGGHVVYYRHFMPKTSPLYDGHLYGDYYPPRWLGLE